MYNVPAPNAGVVAAPKAGVEEGAPNEKGEAAAAGAPKAGVEVAPKGLAAGAPGTMVYKMHSIEQFNIQF